MRRVSSNCGSLHTNDYRTLNNYWKPNLIIMMIVLICCIWHHRLSYQFHLQVFSTAGRQDKYRKPSFMSQHEQHTFLCEFISEYCTNLVPTNQLLERRYCFMAKTFYLSRGGSARAGAARKEHSTRLARHWPERVTKYRNLKR